MNGLTYTFITTLLVFLLCSLRLNSFAVGGNAAFINKKLRPPMMYEGIEG